MYTFPTLLKKIRKESDLTQEELAKALGVSKVLISMVETGQKEVSKKFILKLADKLDVQPNSITPFLLIDEDFKKNNISKLEKKLVNIGEQIQDFLIEVKSKNLKKYAS